MFALMLAMLLILPVNAVNTRSDCMEPKEARVIVLIREIRVQYGLAPVASSDVLSASAEHFAQDMKIDGSIDHIMRNGTTWSENQRKHGYTYNTWRAQNVAAGQRSPEAVVSAWMASQDHRDVLLSPYLRRLGVGHTFADGLNYWVLDAGGYPDARANRC